VGKKSPSASDGCAHLPRATDQIECQCAAFSEGPRIVLCPVEANRRGIFIGDGATNWGKSKKKQLPRATASGRLSVVACKKT
jgi:hypothetical protein